jgi:YD repeat-containing protein
VSKVIKATNDSILYRYDATGQRISKTFKDKTTFYVRDASGNVMATYEQTTTTTTVKEINIYGSSRVGTYNGKESNNILIHNASLFFCRCLCLHKQLH